MLLHFLKISFLSFLVFPSFVFASSYDLSGFGTSAVNGCYASAGTYQGEPYYEKGVITSGILSIDVKKSASLGGTYTSIFSSAPAINFAVDPDYTVSQGVFNGLNVVVAGEYLRLDVTALPSVPLSRFNILVYGTI